jgi:hypothetical protein
MVLLVSRVLKVKEVEMGQEVKKVRWVLLV